MEEAQEILAGSAPRWSPTGSPTSRRRRRADVWRHRPRLRPRARVDALDALDAVAEARAWPPGRARDPARRRKRGTKMAILADRVVGGLGVTELLDPSVPRDARGLLDEGLSRSAATATTAPRWAPSSRLHTSVLDPAADGDLWGDRLLRRAGEAGERGRLRGHDLSTPRRPSPRARASARRRGRGRLARPLPRGQRLGPRDAVLVFTHDPKFDEPALIAALETDAGFIGALGSRRTHERRVERLARGLDEDRSRASMPPVAWMSAPEPRPRRRSRVLAEVLALRAGPRRRPPAESRGPIHHAPGAFAGLAEAGVVDGGPLGCC